MNVEFIVFLFVFYLVYLSLVYVQKVLIEKNVIKGIPIIPPAIAAIAEFLEIIICPHPPILLHIPRPIQSTLSSTSNA